MHVPILIDLVIIFSLSLPVLFICHRLGIPSIVGFLATGVLVGPGVFGLISAIDEVHILAEIGVVLLLFTIGIEFSLKSLLRIKRTVLLGGALQVVFTIAAAAVLSRLFGVGMRESIFIGMLIALSSTAIVLRVLQENAQIDTPHGNAALGILIFQDIAVVPMMIATPLLAGAADLSLASLGMLGVKVIGAFVMVYVAARWIVPHGLYQIARTRDNDLFLLAIVFLALATAWLTAEIGLSLALGAFLAGLIISESEYSHRALGNVLSFRDVFTSFFFVSIGLLMDPKTLTGQPLLILGLAVGVIVLKVVTGGFAAIVLGLPFKTALTAALALSQLGEFSFILSKTGLDNGIFAGASYQIFLSVSILTMVAAPFLILKAPDIARLADRLPLPQKLKRGAYIAPMTSQTSDLSDHVIVVGYGVTGRNVVRAATEALIPYEIIEMNPDTVHAERGRGEVIHYGDATQATVLRHAGIARARVLVATIPDAASTRRTVELARRLNPGLHIIARTRFVREMEPLQHLGANEVVPEEYETSLEIFSRVLRTYLVPNDEIAKFVAEVRGGDYDMLRTAPDVPTAALNVARHLRGLDIATFEVEDGASAAGRTLADVELRKLYQVTVLAIRRGDDSLLVPDGNTELQIGDLLVCAGHPERIAEVGPLFRAADPA